MEFSFMMNIDATKEKIWDYYSDIQKWYVWENDLKNITLDGEFVTGATGTMELEGMPAVEYILTLVRDKKEFWDKTTTPFGDVYFGHEIIEKEDNTLNVKHTVRLESDVLDQDRLEFLKQVFADVPDSIALLKKTVENNDSISI